eukprot:3955450-Prymnesium_polylepis.1
MSAAVIGALAYSRGNGSDTLMCLPGLAPTGTCSEKGPAGVVNDSRSPTLAASGTRIRKERVAVLGCSKAAMRPL